MSSAPTTDDLGMAIRDALGLIQGVELASTPDAEPAVIDYIDDSDFSRLGIIVGESVFEIQIIRKV